MWQGNAANIGTPAGHEMTIGIIAVVLFAAILHASWNALVKGSSDRAVTLAHISLGHVIPGFALVAISPNIVSEAWPYIIASTVIHWGYYYFLNVSYRLGDLSLIYPIARGLAPVLIAIGAQYWAAETLPLIAWVGIMIVSFGILILAFNRSKASGAAISAALVTSLFIASYSIVDGIGIRVSGDPVAYIGWLFIAELFVIFFVWFRFPKRLVAVGARVTMFGIGGGLLSGLAYGLVLYAKTLAPLGIVSALRETSVIFAALIGVVLMNERPIGRRVSAAIVVAIGIIVLTWY